MKMNRSANLNKEKSNISSAIEKTRDNKSKIVKIALVIILFIILGCSGYVIYVSLTSFEEFEILDKMFGDNNNAIIENKKYENWKTYEYKTSDFMAEAGPHYEYQGSISFKYPEEYTLTQKQCRWSEWATAQTTRNIGRINFGEFSVFNADIHNWDDVEIFDLNDDEHLEYFETYDNEESREIIEGYEYEVIKVTVVTEIAPGVNEEVVIYQVDTEKVGFWFTVSPERLDEYEETILDVIDSIEVE